MSGRGPVAAVLHGALRLPCQPLGSQVGKPSPRQKRLSGRGHEVAGGPATLPPLPVTVLGTRNNSAVSPRPPRDPVTQAPKETLSKQGRVSGECGGSLVPAGPGKRGGWGSLPPNPSSGLEGGGGGGFPAMTRLLEEGGSLHCPLPPSPVPPLP